MRLLIFSMLFAVALSGCTTQSPNPWEGLAFDNAPATKPIDCGGFPQPMMVDDQKMIYDLDGANALNAYRICSEQNEYTSDQHVAQIAQLKITRQALVDAGRSQRNIADMRQQMIEDERKHHFWQSMGLYVLIAALTGASF